MWMRIKRRLSSTWQVLRTGALAEPYTRTIPSITAEEVAEIRQFFPLEKFFIFGHARSGTTLLARLVRLHPEVHCNYQAHFFTRPPLLSGMASGKEYEEWLTRRSNRWNRGKDLTPVALRAMSDYILERDARREGATVVGDKSPNVMLNGRAVREMHTFYPDGRLIYIVRDGRDTLISHRFQNFIDGSQFLPKEDIAIRDDFEKNPNPYFSGERSLFTEKSIRRMVSGWVENVTETDQMGRTLFGDHYYVLRYEDLLNTPYQEMERLWTFLGVDPKGLEEAVEVEMRQNPDADWQKEKAAELIAPLEKGKRGSWRQLFTTRDKKVFKEIAGQLLIDWDFAEDLEW
jgi:hypothetical protein